jgi:hypothetical protein
MRGYRNFYLSRYRRHAHAPDIFAESEQQTFSMRDVCRKLKAQQQNTLLSLLKKSEAFNIKFDTFFISVLVHILQYTKHCCQPF